MSSEPPGPVNRAEPEASPAGHRPLGLLLGTLAAVCAAALAVHGPIAQDPSYHGFADRRGLWGIHNAADVLSNLGFLAVAVLALRVRNPRAGRAEAAASAEQDHAIRWFFLGVGLTSLGSGYYHLAPDDARLIWDRLPMAIAFAALSVDFCQRIFAWRSRILLATAISGALLATMMWRWTGDLRAYVFVQFVPVVAIVLLLGLRRTRGPIGLLLQQRLPPWLASRYLQTLGLYVLAKLCEHFDQEIFALCHGLLAGHALKHLLAALGCLRLVEVLRRGSPGATSGATSFD